MSLFQVMKEVVIHTAYSLLTNNVESEVLSGTLEQQVNWFMCVIEYVYMYICIYV